MFGSWKSRVRHDKDDNSEAAAVFQVVTWDDETLSEIEEELSTFINRQLAWQGLSKAKQIPSWMKTASLNRCAKTPPLPPKTGPPPAAPPRSRRSRSRLRDLGGSLSSTSWTPTPPLRRARSRSRSTASLQSILPPQPWVENWPRLHVSYIFSV